MIGVCVCIITLIMPMLNRHAVCATDEIVEGCYSEAHSVMSAPMSNADDGCNITVWNKSSLYFRSLIKMRDPRLIRFNLTFSWVTAPQSNVHVGHTDDAFMPYSWVWTYESTQGHFPYLNWNIDYGLLSFGLLDAETLKVNPWVNLLLSEGCNITLGTENTTKAIGRALTEMTQDLNDDTVDGPKFDSSYYCFLARNPDIKDTFAYTAAVYFMFPISYINYNCCKTCHDYVYERFGYNCSMNQIEKWSQCLIGPYILGVLIFLYFPIYVLNIADYLAKKETIVTRDNPLLSRDDKSSEWVSLDGSSPYPFSELFSSFWFGLNVNHPIVASKIRRILLLVFAPVGVYAQLLLYGNQEPNLIIPVLKFGTPTGFLTLLGDEKDQSNFAPWFGGPLSLLCAYHVIGIVFLVLPRSLKQVVENGIPVYTNPVSPLFLGIQEVRILSKMTFTPSPGYGNAAFLCRCGVYLVFNKAFWERAFEIQVCRVSKYCLFSGNVCKVCFLVLLIPVYVVLCIFEYIVCLVYYAIPLCVFVSILVAGACRSLYNFFRLRCPDQSSCCRNVCISPLIFIGMPIVLAMFLHFSYAAGLIFIESFYFLSEIAVFTFVSVIVFPSISFGYLFFFLVLVYYLARLIRDFGDGYLKLLSDVVDISRKLFNTNHDIEPPKNQPASMQKLKLENDYYAIPRPLFEFVVERHLPVHRQLLRVILHVVFVITLIAVTLSIITRYVTGPTSDISEVMHILFIVIVGAIPRVLEFVFLTASHVVKRDIKLRKLRRSVEEFWERRHDNQMSDNISRCHYGTFGESVVVTSFQSESVHVENHDVQSQSISNTDLINNVRVLNINSSSNNCTNTENALSNLETVKSDDLEINRRVTNRSRQSASNISHDLETNRDMQTKWSALDEDAETAIDTNFVQSRLQKIVKDDKEVFCVHADIHNSQKDDQIYDERKVDP